MSNEMDYCETSGPNDLKPEPNAHQLITKLIQIRKENILLKSLNQQKDTAFENILKQFNGLKQSFLSAEELSKKSSEIIQCQKLIINEFKCDLEKATSDYKETRDLLESKVKQLESEKKTIKDDLTSELNKASCYIKEQEKSIDELKQRMISMKKEYDDIQRALKARCLERLEKAAKQFEEEKEVMTIKLKRTREFYDIESKELNEQIKQLKEEIEMLRQSDFHPVTRGRKGRTPGPKTTTPKERAKKAGRGGGPGRAKVAKKSNQVSDEVFIDPKANDALIYLLSDDANDKDKPSTSKAADVQSDRSLSPMEWLTPQALKTEDSD